jgi:hypothetical protein
MGLFRALLVKNAHHFKDYYCFRQAKVVIYFPTEYLLFIMFLAATIQRILHKNVTALHTELLELCNINFAAKFKCHTTK